MFADTGETRTWEHEENQEGAYLVDRHEGYLMLRWEGDIKGEWTTEIIPWARITSYTVSRLRNRRRKSIPRPA